MYKGLAIAVLVHGLYDFCIFTSPILGAAFGLLTFPIVILMLLRLKRTIKMAIDADVYAARVPQKEFI